MKSSAKTKRYKDRVYFELIKKAEALVAQAWPVSAKSGRGRRPQRALDNRKFGLLHALVGEWRPASTDRSEGRAIYREKKSPLSYGKQKSVPILLRSIARLYSYLVPTAEMLVVCDALCGLAGARFVCGDIIFEVWEENGNIEEAALEFAEVLKFLGDPNLIRSHALHGRIMPEVLMVMAHSRLESLFEAVRDVEEEKRVTLLPQRMSTTTVDVPLETKRAVSYHRDFNWEHQCILYPRPEAERRRDYKNEVLRAVRENELRMRLGSYFASFRGRYVEQYLEKATKEALDTAFNAGREGSSGDATVLVARKRLRRAQEAAFGAVGRPWIPQHHKIIDSFEGLSRYGDIQLPGQVSPATMAFWPRYSFDLNADYKALRAFFPQRAEPGPVTYLD